MGIMAIAADERVAGVKVTRETLSVSLRDGRTIIVPLDWYPRLLNATAAQRKNWQVAGGGYGIHWPDIDEDLSTEGLLRGAPSTASGSQRCPSPSERSHEIGQPRWTSTRYWLKSIRYRLMSASRSPRRSGTESRLNKRLSH